MSAFEVEGHVLRPKTPIDEAQRTRAAHVLAAVCLGLDPVEVTECLRTDSWPEEVRHVLDSPMQRDELGNFADALAAVLGI